MKLRSLLVRNVPPIKFLKVENLKDVVVLAGPNGVGKSRLIAELIQTFANPIQNNKIDLELEATCPFEREKWNGETVNTAVQRNREKLASSIYGHWPRGKLQSTLFTFAGERNISRIAPERPSVPTADEPDNQVVANRAFEGLASRWPDTQYAIIQKEIARRLAIADLHDEAKHRKEMSMGISESDPLAPIEESFFRLLGPKRLNRRRLRDFLIRYDYEGREFELESLSSGEMQALGIVWDFVVRSPRDCICVFDEPELHLHPELALRLVRTLRAIGERNQFIFSTHSADIISAHLSHSVVMIQPPKSNEDNQAVAIQSTGDNQPALDLLSEHVGMICLGRKIVIIEGTQSSVDAKTYSTIVEAHFPGLVLAPSEGRGAIERFSRMQQSIIKNTLWGLEFYMLCDGDTSPQTTNTGSNLRTLPRYHIENYFLDVDLVAAMFAAANMGEPWLRDPSKIEERLVEIARRDLSFIASLKVGADVRRRGGRISIASAACHNLSIEGLVSETLSRAANEEARIYEVLEIGKLEKLIRSTYAACAEDLQSGNWRKTFPGKPLLSSLANQAGVTTEEFVDMYLAQARRCKFSVFQEISDIFAEFAA